jgi:tetratricopeptide (TPR) repeat protein
MGQPARVPGVDPSRVNTPAALAACLDGLRRRRGLSYEAMERTARNLPSRPPGEQRWESLGKSTVGEIVAGKRLPTRGKLLAFLAVCDVGPADRAQWLAAWERAATAELAVPAGAVRVREARPRLLGVHAPIQIQGAPGDLPPYVLRDLDADLRGVIAAGAEAGGFVLLVGGSSVGKTRTLYEAILATVPDWWLIHPNRDQPAALQALAAAPTPRTVIWLDELQRYLGTTGALTAGTVRTLLQAGMLLVATIWPDEYAVRMVPRQPDRDNQNERDRELLDLAKVFDVADAFTAAELARARALGTIDPRIAVALDSLDGGLTQVLAAGPELVRRWEQAPDPYAKATITAVIDARRLGAESPITTEFLATAVAGYLTSAQRATAPGDWLHSALAYATTPLHGATSALSPVDNGTMGGVAGHTVADYLLQHGRRVRSTVLPPHRFWSAVGAHITDADDLARLAQSASARGLPAIAEQLWRAAIAAGHPSARRLFARHLRAQRRLSDAERVLRDAVAAGEPHTRGELAHMLTEQDRLTEAEQLWRDGLASDHTGLPELAGFLASQQRFAEAEQLARTAISTGDNGARTTLGWLLEVQDRLDDAEQVLRQAAAEDPDGVTGLAWRRLAGVLARHGRHAEAERMLQHAIDAGTPDARRWLAGILEKQDRYDEAERVLRDNVAHDEFFGRSALFRFLQLRGRTREAEQLGRDGVAAGDHFVRYDLIELLDEQERYDDAEQILRAAFAGGKPGAWQQLADMLEKKGRLNEAKQIRRNGSRPDGSLL